MTPDHCVQEYWDSVATDYDQVFPETLIGRLQRQAVWRELGGAFHEGQRVLELNCGTGIDAVRLAVKGVRVLACDVSPRMIAIATNRAAAADVASSIDFRVLPTEEISALSEEKPFDGAFSNFSGLNCVADHSAVARALAGLLSPGSLALFCVMGRFVPLEIAWFALGGRFNRATARLRNKLASADFPGRVNIPSVGALARAFQPEFRLESWRGIGVSIPPSSLGAIAAQFPRLTGFLANFDDPVSRIPVLRGWGDCVLLQFRRL